MSYVIKKTTLKPDADQKSRVRQKTSETLRLVEDIRHLHPDLLRKVRNAVLHARQAVEGVVANDQGQILLFPEMDEEIEIPRDKAKQIIAIAQKTLEGSGLKLKEKNDSVKIIANPDEKDDPYRDLGY